MSEAPWRGIWDFLNLNPLKGFALGAAGVALIVTLLLGLSGHIVVLVLLFASYFGGFYFLGHLFLLAKGSAQRWNAQRKANSASAAERAHNFERLRADGIRNLPLLADIEAMSIKWMYHNNQSRIRASIHDNGIDGLVRLKILIIEGGPYYDHTLAIPDYIVEEIAKAEGDRDPRKAYNEKPWEIRPGRIRI